MVDHDDGLPPQDPLRLKATEWLTRLQSGAEPECHDDFLAWYQADHAHADAFDSVQASWKTMELSREIDPAAIDAGPSGRPVEAKTEGRSARWYLAIAASLVALFIVLAGLAYAHIAGNWSAKGARQELASQVGEIRTIRLADGSHITLDSASELKVDFSGRDRRIILLRGRARFDVAHDASRPFMVQAGDHVVIAHGTMFDVELLDRGTRVALLRGSIEVKALARAWQADSSRGQMLTPGLRLMFEEHQDISKPLPIAAGETSWVDGMLSFTDAPIGDIIAAANRYNLRKILLKEPDLANRLYTISFPARDNAGLAANLAASQHLQLSNDTQGNFILQRGTVKK